MTQENQELIQPDKDQESIAKKFGGYTAEQVAVIQRTVAKGCDKVETAYFLEVCKTMNLNPFNKEVWCYKDHRGNQVMFAGRDGFLSKAQQNPSFAGMRSSEFCANDEIEIDIPNAQVKHKINPVQDRGAIVGAYAFVFRKDGEPTLEFADMKRYNKNQSAWKSHPEEMIKKVAESHALKKAFGISLQVEDEWKIEDQQAKPIETPQDQESALKDEALRRIEQKPAEELVNTFSDDFLEKFPEVAEKLNEKLGL